MGTTLSFFAKAKAALCGLIRRSSPPSILLTAEDILPTLTSIAVAPSVDTYHPEFPFVSVACGLFQLREDGSILRHDREAVFRFDSGQWVEFLPSRNLKQKVIKFRATHYQSIAEFATPSPEQKIAFLNKLNQRYRNPQ